MLAKKYRIHLKKDFARIFAEGVFKHNHPYLTIHFLKDDSLENNKYAFIFSKKQEKTAVGRNLILRQARHIVQDLIKDNKIKEKYFIIFVLKKEIMPLDYKKKTEVVEQGLEKSGLI